MAFEFRLPDIGEGLTEATVVRWLVPVGGEVALDQPVVELETDKAVVDIPAPKAGTVLHHGAAEGATLEVGEILLVIGDAGESWSPSAEPAPAESRPAAPIVGTLEEAPDAAPSSAPAALPLVRRLAASKGVDLAGVAGTGPGGRITREDVEAAADGAGPVERVRLSPTRLAIARNLTRSWQEIPHVTTYGAADAGGILTERSRLAESTGKQIPLEAVLMTAIAPLLAEYPAFNASLDGETLVLKKHYDLGFAVETPEGLMVAVVRGVPGRTIEDLAEEIVSLAAAARDRSIAPKDLRGATFTLSNIGAVGGGYGTPIIPYGTTAILSVGRAEERPVVRGGEVVVAREMPLSLSYDHRVIDGALGREFMSAIVSAIETRG
ncbi:MAG TPA: dihydrolipoamide acetyltransferase family protein [Acidimicrobiia bacterium]|nr:dihydrolipoamide acetyltransferase family protein [Acidimicrobiia bacterium]